MRFQVTGHLDRADQVSVLESAGLVPVNWSAVMRVHLDRTEPSTAAGRVAGRVPPPPRTAAT